MAKRRAKVEVTLRDRATRGLRRLGGAVGTLTKAFGLLTAAAGAAVGFFGGRFLRGAIQSTGEFDESMSRVAAVTGAVGEELQSLRDAADQASATTRFTATEAANGLEELARAGQNANQAIETLNPVLALAAGNNQSVAESAIQVTTALNAYGLAAEDSARVSDVYTRAAQRSAQTTGQLADAMTFVAPVARQAGLDIEETAALVGRLADQGFRGSMGGTALRNAILQLQDPTSAFRRELSAVGIEGDDFIDVLEQLSEAGEDSEAAIRSLGLRAGPAIQALVSGGAPAIRGLVTELREAEGASAAAAATLEDNLPGALRGLASAWDAARRQLVEPLVDRITEQVQGLSSRIRELVSSGEIQEFAQLLRDGFDAALDAVQSFVGNIDFSDVQRRLGEFVTNARERISEFGEQANRLGTIWDQVIGSTQVAVGLVRTAFNGLGTVIAASLTLVTNQVSNFLGALNLLTGGTSETLKAIRREVDAFGADFAESARKFAESAGDANQQIAEGIDRIGSAGSQAGKDIKAGTDEAVEGLSELETQTQRSEQQVDAIKDRLREAGLSAEQLGDQAEDAGEKLDGLSNETDDTGGAFDRMREQIAEALDAESFVGLGEARVELGKLRAAGELTADEFDALSGKIQGAVDDLNQLEPDKGLERVSSGAERARESVRDVGDEFEETGRRGVGAGQAIAGILGSWRQLSESAAAAVDTFLSKVTGGTVQGFFSRLAGFTDQLEEQQSRQIEQADRLEAQYRRTGNAVEFARGAQQLLNSELLLLDESRVESLTQAMRAAREEVEATQQATGDLVRGLEDDLLRLEGRTEELERRRLERRREEIRLQLEQQGLDQESRANLRQALELLDRKGEVRREQARESEREREESEGTAEAAEREADAVERTSRARARAPMQQSEVRVVFDATNLTSDGGPQLSPADQEAISQMVIRAISTDQGRGL